MIGFGLAGGLSGLIVAMAIAGIGIGPTIVTLYSLAAERSVTDAAGRSVSVPEKPQRIVVMHEGRIARELRREEADEENVVRAATGQVAA